MKYTMVLLVPFYRVDENTIACESAFAAHLKELLPRISDWGNEIVIHSPQMSPENYQKNKKHLAHIDCQKESIFYIAGLPENTSRAAFLLKAPFKLWPVTWKVVREANVIHSAVSKDIFKLFTVMSLLFAALQRKKSICVMDIDHRNSAKMSYLTGKFSYKSFFVSQYIYNPLISLQVKFSVKFCDLLMLKGQALVDDFGKGKDKVKNFYDTAHDLSFVLEDKEYKTKLARWDASKTEIKLVYFGRLVAYKGIKDMILAVKKVSEKLQGNGSNKQVSFTIVGAGEQEQELQQQVTDLKLEHLVTFFGALSYGKDLFDHLEQYDFLLAAPHSEDTPRSVFDAMACGLPMIAYDTYYYKDLERLGMVTTVPWRDIDAMAEQTLALADQPQKVQNMIKAGRDFATNNTQKIWLDRRLQWTKEFLGK